MSHTNRLLISPFTTELKWLKAGVVAACEQERRSGGRACRPMRIGGWAFSSSPVFLIVIVIIVVLRVIIVLVVVIIIIFVVFCYSLVPVILIVVASIVFRPVAPFVVSEAFAREMFPNMFNPLIPRCGSEFITNTETTSTLERSRKINRTNS